MIWSIILCFGNREPRSMILYIILLGESYIQPLVNSDFILQLHLMHKSENFILNVITSTNWKHDNNFIMCLQCMKPFWSTKEIRRKPGMRSQAPWLESGAGDAGKNQSQSPNFLLRCSHNLCSMHYVRHL